MEAYALGRPVIGARIGGIPELIREGETGFMFEAANVDSLTEVLSSVQALPQSKLGQMGSAGRERMRSEFSPELYRNRMLSLYQTIEPSI
jgi:glycosyltransferase involved in cell wall biosynthesis